MFSRRYTVLIADRSSGVVRRVTISLRAVTAVVGSALMMPVLIGLGARWSSSLEMHQLRATNTALTVENGNYRETTGELASQIQSLEGVIDELGSRSALDPAQANAIAKLPAVVKNRAVGGTSQTNAALSAVLSTSLVSPEDTFGVLRTLLTALETRLSSVRKGVERQEKLAAATPSIWPAKGWLTARFGGRSDPFTGESEFHQGLDISASKGQPVYATADGKVDAASYEGEYGNLIVLSHDFGITTRYGHLSGFNIKRGQTVHRGDVIGYVGSTGRSTGAHLHYEILVNGKLLNPMQLLTQPSQSIRE
ncbi:MAG TPA: M23 family metallopeptidase [Vicinamibacterales bacterium]|nr:M23 family metallopeptidase [Vicinamibacterales bacterium]